MVKVPNKQKRPKGQIFKKVMYSTFGISVVSGLVAVLGAPTKWS